jgi:hypothetical protein
MGRVKDSRISLSLEMKHGYYSPVRKKFLRTPSMGKLMLKVFWDH